jgi:hypothetical protein
VLQPRAIQSAIQHQLGDSFRIWEKRPGVMQIAMPYYHEDGDAIEIFIEQSPEPGNFRLSDYAQTLMRLSYSYEIDSPNKERILARILSESHVKEDNGIIYLDAPSDKLYSCILQFAQAVSRVGAMRNYRRDVINNLFYEQLEHFIGAELQQYNPRRGVQPLPGRDDLEVDFSFQPNGRPVYLFAVKDSPKARLSALSCLEFQRAGLNFTSAVVYDDFEHFNKKDRSRLTSASDKQFINLQDFVEHMPQFLEREANHSN